MEIGLRVRKKLHTSRIQIISQLIVLGMLTGKMSLPSITTAKSAWVIGQRKECICHEMLVYFVQKTLIDFKLSSITNNKEQHEQRGTDLAHKRTCGCSYAWKKWELVFSFFERTELIFQPLSYGQVCWLEITVCEAKIIKGETCE